MTWENPVDATELSRARYEEALDHVEAVLQRDWGEDADVLNEMRIIRMIGMTRVPWWGQVIDHDDSSVTVGVMMRNAFEAFGDSIDDPGRAAHWFTRAYLRRWREGKREYQEWLDTLFRRNVDRPAG